MFAFLKPYRQFLTKNERNKVYLRKNTTADRMVADSKYRTKKILAKANIGVPLLIKRFKTIEELDNFRWEDLEGNFVIKPESGYGGEGIIIIRRRAKWAGEWQKMNGQIITTQDIKLHCQDVLAGRYSMHGASDPVLVEERIRIHPMFLAITKVGTPDIRVIVYNKVPVMAMFRIPTEKSGGKANLQQGAVGLGIDLASGITTFGIEGKGEPIRRIYDYGKKKMRKVNGIKIPFWKEILETAVNCQKAIPGLGFLGVDVVLDKEKGPMVLEVNARPGLSIQICNKAGLKARMDKLEEIEVRSTEHAITLAKYLFGESFSDKVEEKEKVKLVGPLENIKIKTGKGKKNFKEVTAKIDTGAYRSSIDRVLAQELGLLDENKILYYRHYKSALGKNNDRPVVGLTFWLNGRKIVTAVNVADRHKLRTKFLLGRKDLGGFLISAKS
ncbi:MAG: sugar-transfer associated ATP-grasp domain-containing protein [Candidatus Shapirobacteria bacterium]|nr:sugar-transfer associated ATP-grasp domain-containing protein [Candidatus Shapirobacteria bacterium]